MINSKKVLGSIVLSLAIGASTAQAAHPVEAGADLIIARPIAVVTTVASTAFFIATLPITYAGNSHNEAAETFVTTPYNATFKKPLGTILAPEEE